MKRWFIILTFLLISKINFAQSLTPDTGDHGAGNGGGAYVCIDEHGVTTKAILEDIIEATYIYKLDLKFNELDKEEVLKILYKEDLTIYKHVKESWDRISSQFLQSVGPMKLNLANTSNKSISSFSGCQKGEISRLVTVTLYEKRSNTDFMMTDEEVYNVMDEQSKFALMLHEIIFEATRVVYNDTNSERARALVGAILSSNSQRIFKVFIPQTLQDALSIGIDYAIKNMNDKYDEFYRFYRDEYMKNILNLNDDNSKIKLVCKGQSFNSRKKSELLSYKTILKNNKGKLSYRIKGDVFAGDEFSKDTACSPNHDNRRYRYYINSEDEIKCRGAFYNWSGTKTLVDYTCKIDK